MTLLTTNQPNYTLHLVDTEKCFILEIKTDIEKLSKRQTPPINGHFFFVFFFCFFFPPTVSANWREYHNTAIFQANMKMIHKSRSAIANLPTEIQDINLCKLSPTLSKFESFQTSN